MPFHMKILIPRSESSGEIQEFCHIFYAGKSILANKVSNFQNFLGEHAPGPMARIDNALI